MNTEPFNSHCRWAEEREANWREHYAAHEQAGPDWRVTRRPHERPLTLAEALLLSRIRWAPTA